MKQQTKRFAYSNPARIRFKNKYDLSDVLADLVAQCINLDNTYVRETPVVQILNVNLATDADDIDSRWGLLKLRTTADTGDLLQWYMSMNQNIDGMLVARVPRYNATAATRGLSNAQYGCRVFGANSRRKSPFSEAIKHLLDDPQNRRAVISYIDATDFHCEDASHDCTEVIATQFQLIRLHGCDLWQLVYTVNQRACNAVSGFGEDAAWHALLIKIAKHILSFSYQLAAEVLVTWNIGNLYIRRADFDKAIAYTESRKGKGTQTLLCDK